MMGSGWDSSYANDNDRHSSPPTVNDNGRYSSPPTVNVSASKDQDPEDEFKDLYRLLMLKKQKNSTPKDDKTIEDLIKKFFRDPIGKYKYYAGMKDFMEKEFPDIFKKDSDSPQHTPDKANEPQQNNAPNDNDQDKPTMGNNQNKSICNSSDKMYINPSDFF